MAYRLFCGVAQSTDEYLALKPGWMARVYNELDDALGFALKAIEARHTQQWPEEPWEIEGDDGLQLDRQEILRQVQDRRAELIDRPKVY